jgi:hypothetical protein
VSLPGSHRIHLFPLCLCLLGVSTFYAFFLSKSTSVHNNGHNDLSISMSDYVYFYAGTFDDYRFRYYTISSNIEPCDILRIFWSVFNRGKEFWEDSG